VLRKSAAALAALGLIGLTGCFVYVPAEVDAIAPGEVVRLVVTRSAAAELADVTLANAPVVRGTLARREQDGLFVRVPARRGATGSARSRSCRKSGSPLVTCWRSRSAGGADRGPRCSWAEQGPWPPS
jgi:hypothetical protein